MKFKVAEDVDAPVGFTFARVTDFTQLETEARGRGADLRREGNWVTAEQGCKWRGSAQIRGKLRRIEAEITTMLPDERFVVESAVGGMDCRYEVAFIELNPNLTRISAELDLTARTLTARLILQTLKLARGRVVQRMTSSLARQGNAVEAEWRRAQQG